jgi:hypothetical protein
MERHNHPPILYVQWDFFQVLGGRILKITTHFHLTLRLIISPLFRIGGHLYSSIIDGVKERVYRSKKLPHKETLSIS